MYETGCGAQGAQLDKVYAKGQLSAPVASDSLPDKLNTMEKLTTELHNAIERLSDSLSQVRPEHTGAIAEANAMPPSASPLGERITRFNDSIAHAINRLNRLDGEIDL